MAPLDDFFLDHWLCDDADLEGLPPIAGPDEKELLEQIREDQGLAEPDEEE